MSRVKIVVAALCLAILACVVIVLYSGPLPLIGREGGDVGESKSVQFRDTQWEDLRPKGWDQFKMVDGMQRDMRSMSDSDPRAVAMLKEMKQVWDDAPTISELDGKAVRIPGYVVPLDQNAEGLTELLLVPYFGACIHSPPPPSNQVIHVTLPKRTQGIRSMDPVWVRGTLRVDRTQSSVASSSYSMGETHIEPYVVSN